MNSPNIPIGALIAYILLPLFGLIVIYGTFKKWKLLINPDEKNWFVSKFEAYVNNLIPKKAKIIFNYIVGTIIFLYGSINLWGVFYSK